MAFFYLLVCCCMFYINLLFIIYIKMNVEEEAGKDNDLSQSFILTNNEKMQILDGVLSTLEEELPLSISINHDGYKEVQNDIMHIYHVHKNKQVRKTQHSNILFKINELNSKILQNEEQQQAQKSQDEDNMGQVLNYRYFQGNVVCFRCKKEGHYRQMCPEQYSCLFCLSLNHNSDRCPQKNVCYRCYGLGHVNQKCPLKQNPQKCLNCQRSHFGGCYFLTKGTDRTKKMFHTDTLANNPDIICPKCLKYGHIQC